jgi:hypothetical protein
VLVGGDANAEMHVRTRVLGLPARADDADLLALPDLSALLDAEGAHVRQRHGIAVGGRDRDREPVRRHGAGERHRTAGGSADRLVRVGTHVDAAVLAACIRIRAEHERPQDGAADRPRPRIGGRGKDQRDRRRGEGDPILRCRF